MITSPQLIEWPAFQAAILHLQIPRSEMMSAMPLAVAELRAAIKAQELQIHGPLFAHHLSLSAAEFNFEAGFQVEGDVTPQGRVSGRAYPSMRVAHVTYVGGYEGLGAAWGEFARLGKSQTNQDLQPTPDIWEIYTVGPESGLDPGQWRTELIQPVEP